MRPLEFPEEELDEQGMRDLEATLAQHSVFIILKGDRLRRYEERLDRLAEIFRRTTVIPVDRPIPLESSRRRNVHALMRPAQTHMAGPSQSIDSTHDFGRRTSSDREFLSGSSRDSILGPEVVLAMDNGQQPDFMAAAVPVHSSQVSADSAMYSKEQKKFPELESEVSDEAIPAALMSGSGRGDSLIPDTATTGDTGRLTDMNDWIYYKPLTSFTDYHVPDTMRVNSFYDLPTQVVVASHLDDVERRPRPRTPEKDLSSTDGLLFSVDSYEMMHTARESTTAATSSSDFDSDAAEGVLSRLRENRRRRKFKVSRVSISPNFPVNVWDDVAPTRLHAHLINITMDQDQNVLPVMP